MSESVNPEEGRPENDPAVEPVETPGDTPGETSGETPNGDALSQAEEILNDVEVPAEESVAQGTDKAAAEELRNDLLRLQAEYVNYRKRVERDRAVAGQMAVIGVLNSLLPVLDDIDAGRSHGDIADGPFAAIAGKLETALATYGLERIDATGVPFDPTVHEALIQQPSADVEIDTVSQVLRNGFKSGERVLRAAQVIVAVPE
jgi:molecular chaperone GrpE